MVGIRNHKRKTLTLLPAAGEQIVRLRPRLADRRYDAPARDEEVTDKSKHERTTVLVQAFGSTRRSDPQAVAHCLIASASLGNVILLISHNLWPLQSEAA